MHQGVGRNARTPAWLPHGRIRFTRSTLPRGQVGTGIIPTLHAICILLSQGLAFNYLGVMAQGRRVFQSATMRSLWSGWERGFPTFDNSARSAARTAILDRSGACPSSTGRWYGSKSSHRKLTLL